MTSPTPPLELLLENSRQVYFVYNLTRNQFAYVNAAVEPLFGIHKSRAEQMLPSLLQRIHPDDREYAAECLEKLRADRLREDIELRLLNGQDAQEAVSWYTASLTHYQDPAGDDLIGGSVADTTELKHYVLNTEKFNAKKNSTLEILSHDLAAPLHFMQTITQQLQRNLRDQLDVRSLALIRRMEQTCRESVTMLQEFVNNEFMESVNVELNLTRVNLSDRLALLIDNYQNTDVNGIMHYALHAEPGIYAFIDENKLLQVFNNLVSNAIKFTPDGGQITLTLAQEDEHHVLITVADTGIGIPAAMQPVLFERFTKARRPGLRGETSIGLGMSIIKTIVELHQGTIWFESTEGVGTTFFIRLANAPARD